MKTISKSLSAALALCSALAGAAPASAQSWGGNGYANGYNNGYNINRPGPRELAQIDRYHVVSTCSGERGFLLENRLRREVDHGQIGGWAARRIQAAIDDLQHQERRECRERDYQSARDIGRDYTRIRAWLDDETGRYRAGNWNGNGGGYWRR